MNLLAKVKLKLLELGAQTVDPTLRAGKEMYLRGLSGRGIKFSVKK